MERWAQSRSSSVVPVFATSVSSTLTTLPYVGAQPAATLDTACDCPAGSVVIGVDYYRLFGANWNTLSPPRSK